VLDPAWLVELPACLIIRLIIQTIRRDPSGAIWTDEASNVSRPDPSGADQIDVEHQATDLVVASHSQRSLRRVRRRGGDCTAHAADQMGSVLASHGGVLLASGGDR
jgi:hypothetical protein